MDAEETNQEPAYVVDLDQLPQPQLTGHMWMQQGTELTCRSCPFTHSSFIPPEYQLYGIDDKGMPLIRRITVKH